MADTAPPEISIRRNSVGANNGSLGAISFGAYSSGTTYSQGALILARGNGNWSAANQGTDLAFHTTALNSTSSQERMRLDSAGHLLVGRTSTASSATDYGTQVYSTGQIYQFAQATGSTDVHRWHNGDGTKIAYLQGDGDLIITGTVTSASTRSNVVNADHVIQDGAPVIDTLQIIRAFMKLRAATADPDSTVDELREKLSTAVDDIIDQFQDQIDNLDLPEEPTE